MVRFIKDDPAELDEQIWLMPPLYARTWQWIKRKVNFENGVIPMRDGSEFLIYKGQHLTAIRTIASGVGWYEGRAWKEPNPKTISTILAWLIKKEYITVDGGRGNREYTLITLTEREKNKLFGKGVTPNGEGSGEGDGEVREQSMDINKKNKEEPKKKKEKTPKIAYAENVLLTSSEYERLCEDYGKELTDKSIIFLSSYKIEKDYKTKSDNLTIRRWVMDAVKKNGVTTTSSYKTKIDKDNEQIEAFKRRILGGTAYEEASATRSRIDITPDKNLLP